MAVREITTRDDALALQPLLQEYIDFVCADLERAAGVTFDRNILLRNSLNGIDKVVPPLGRTFVFDADGTTQGMVFLRPSGPDAMEIKRLYVRPVLRGTGAGRALVQTTIDAATHAGARELRLDTSANLTQAISMYRRFGFADCAPYEESDHFDDPVLAPHLLFMAKDLSV